MKKYLITLIMFLGFYGMSSALDPVKVAIVNPGATGVQIEAEIIDLDNPTPAVYGQTTVGTFDADDNGIISFRVGAGDPNWDAVGAAGIDGRWVLNIYTNTTLYAQYRLDKILFDQASGLLNLDDDGNLVPDEDDTQSLGTSTNRWSEVFVGPQTVHVGVDGDEGTIGYDETNNELELSINGTQEVVVGETSTTFNGRVEQNIAGSNTVFGSNALSSNTSGDRNVSFGFNSLSSNTLGGFNSAFGFDALKNNTSGGANTAIGKESMLNNLTGIYNTAIGISSMLAHTSGNNNTAIGNRSGGKITTGSQNTFVGAGSGDNILQKVDAVNSTAIGDAAYTTADNQVVIGNTSVTETQLRGVKLMDLAGGGTQSIGVDNNGQITTVAGGGGISTFGYTYAVGSQLVVGGADVIFSNNGPLSGVTHTAGTSTHIVPTSGTYEISYSINISSGSGSAIAIAVNGTVDASTNKSVLTASGPLSGTAILTLAAGDVLTLRNNSATQFQTDASPGVGAQMTIKFLN